jgi:hypothetical protein
MTTRPPDRATSPRPRGRGTTAQAPNRDRAASLAHTPPSFSIWPDETRCAACGALLQPTSTTGRPRRFCADRCRRAAWRRRRRARNLAVSLRLARRLGQPTELIARQLSEASW